MSDVRIREATSDDLDALVALQLELRDHHRDLQPDAPRYQVGEERWRELLAGTLEKSTEQILVASIDDAVVGFAKLVYSPKPWGTSGEIDTLVVTAARRSTGVGEALVRAAERTARERGARGVRANVLSSNQGGRAFWERAGYDLIAVRYSKDF